MYIKHTSDNGQYSAQLLGNESTKLQTYREYSMSDINVMPVFQSTMNRIKGG